MSTPKGSKKNRSKSLMKQGAESKLVLDKKAIGQRLSQARKACGLTQSVLADALGASLQTIKSYEGGRRIPSGKFAERLARGGINLSWLLNGEGAMLLSGEARDAQVDLTGQALGDQGATERMKLRADRAMDQLETALHLVEDTARQCNFVLPNLVHQALALAVLKGLAHDGIEPVIQLLKAQAILDNQEKAPES